MLILVYWQIIVNKGASDIDKISVDELRGYMNDNWSNIKEAIKARTYKLQPVRRVEIPKPYETSILKFKRKLKKLCTRSWSVDLSYRILKLNEVIRGLINYYFLGYMKYIITRGWGLKMLGVNKDLARLTSYCGIDINLSH